jgi:hypothetical protein
MKQDYVRDVENLYDQTLKFLEKDNLLLVLKEV